MFNKPRLKLKSKAPDKLWLMLEEKRNEGRALRLPYERQWQMNLAFLAGRQQVIYNTTTEKLQHIIAQKGKTTFIDNKLLPRYQKQVANLIGSNPRMSVIPASNDTEDLKAAKKGDKVIKWFWRQHKMRKKIRKAGSWIYSCGNVFLEDTWNAELGPIELDPNGTAHYAGDVDIKLWTPFEVLFPCGGFCVSEIDDFPWIMKERFYTLDWIVAKFPKTGSNVAPESSPKAMVDANMLFGLQDTTKGAEGAVVSELKLRPNKEFPKGKRLIGANGVILLEEDYPYDEYHLEQFKDIEVPGVFWGMATLEAGICLQKLWNRTIGDIAEFNRTVARGKWLIPRNSRMEVEPNDEHGQKIYYTPVMGHKPEIMTVKGLPQTYITALEIVSQGLMALFHQHEVTQGTNKSDIRSGDMVQLLLNQDDTGNIPTHAIFEESLESLMTRVLVRIKEGYKTKRIISITGNDNSYEIEEFIGADLRNNTDVHVVKDSTIPESRTVRQLRIRENYKEGLYGNPNDPKTRERVLRMLQETPDDIIDIFAESHLDRQLQQMENYALMKQPGIKIPVNLYDNHAIHLEELRVARKDPEYQKVKLENPQQFLKVEMGLIDHEQQHRALYEEEMKAQEAAIIRREKLMKGGNDD